MVSRGALGATHPVTSGLACTRCEIGANACGVVGGNEAVSSLLAHELGEEPRPSGRVPQLDARHLSDP